MMKHMIFVVLFAGLNVFASAGQPIATIVIAGDSVVTHDEGKGKKEPGTTGFKLVKGDIVSVTSSPAKIVMYKERVVIKVAPNSSVTIIEGSADDQPLINGNIFLKSGKVKLEVKGKNRDKDHFEVHSGNGTLGVRGTIFIVSFDEPSDVTEEYTLDGKVNANAREGYTPTGGSSFRNSMGRKQVLVEKGYMVRIIRDKDASDPIPFGDDMMKKLEDEFETPLAKSKGTDSSNKSINKGK